MRAKTGTAINTVVSAVIARNTTAMTAARAPARPSAPDDASDPTLATSIDATSGITVIRIRLMKIVPTGATMASSVETAGDEEPARANPRTKPATRPIKTRVVKDTARIV